MLKFDKKAKKEHDVEKQPCPFFSCSSSSPFSPVTVSRTFTGFPPKSTEYFRRLYQLIPDLDMLRACLLAGTALDALGCALLSVAAYQPFLLMGRGCLVPVEGQHVHRRKVPEIPIFIGQTFAQ